MRRFYGEEGSTYRIDAQRRDAMRRRSAPSPPSLRRAGDVNNGSTLPTEAVNKNICGFLNI